MEWAEDKGITLTYIQPGKPQQNAYVERYNRVRHWARTNAAFNGSLRHEWRDLYIFEALEEVNNIATEWLWTYNNERPSANCGAIGSSPISAGIGEIAPAMKLRMTAQILCLRTVKTGRITDGSAIIAKNARTHRMGF